MTLLSNSSSANDGNAPLNHDHSTQMAAETALCTSSTEILKGRPTYKYNNKSSRMAGAAASRRQRASKAEKVMLVSDYIRGVMEQLQTRTQSFVSEHNIGVLETTAIPSPATSLHPARAARVDASSCGSSSEQQVWLMIVERMREEIIRARDVHRADFYQSKIAAIPILSSRLQNLSAYRGIPRVENSGSSQAVLYSSMPPSWLCPSTDSDLGINSFEKQLNGVGGQLSSCTYQQNITLTKDATDMSMIDNLTSIDVVNSHHCDAGLLNLNISNSGCTDMALPLMSNYDSELMLAHSKQAAAHVSQYDVPCSWPTMLRIYEENCAYINGTAATTGNHKEDAALRSPSRMNSEQSCSLENLRLTTSYEVKEVSNKMMEQYIQKVLEIEASDHDEAFTSAEMRKDVSCINYQLESHNIIGTSGGSMEPVQEWQIPQSVNHGICHIEEVSTNPVTAFEGCLTSTCHAEQQALTNFSSESIFSSTSAGLSPLPSANHKDNDIDVPTSQSGIAAACHQDDAIR
ncbi:hypothetical protein L7F22_049264 [Adiantum nelumboides]|nr:hypothetical protein [Adiantum nelumboides]